VPVIGILDGAVDTLPPYINAVYPRSRNYEELAVETRLAMDKWNEESVFRHTFTYCIEGICLHRKILDDAGNFVDCLYLDVNDSFSRVTGVSRDAALGKTVRDLFPSVYADKVIDLYRDVLNSGGGTGIEFFFEPTDSWYTLGIHPSSDDSFIVFIENITKSKDALVQKKKTEWQYKSIVDSGIALIWTSGVDGLCEYFNEPWMRFTGRRLEQELGDGWVEGVFPDDRDRCMAIYLDSFAQRREFRMEYRLRNAKGEFRWIEDFGSPRYDDAGQFVGYVGHCVDIEARKKAESALKEKMDELERFYRLTIDRESRMIELKLEVNRLLQAQGVPERYSVGD
jgi:PAS domain S-box-containing protein